MIFRPHRVERLALGFGSTAVQPCGLDLCAIHFIERVRQLGCHVALDDFGAGLSSFSYLKTIPADYLKIDGGFIRDMLVDPMDHAIVEAINNIGHVAGLKTIAESVESDAIKQRLIEIGVDYAQGYAISAPQPLEYALLVNPGQMKILA